jgi:hypothetical protein
VSGIHPTPNYFFSHYSAQMSSSVDLETDGSSFVSEISEWTSSSKSTEHKVNGNALEPAVLSVEEQEQHGTMTFIPTDLPRSGTVYGCTLITFIHTDVA